MQKVSYAAKISTTVFFIPYTGMKLVSKVLKDRFAALLLMSLACTNVH